MKYFTKSGSEAGREQGEAGGIVAIEGRKEPSGVPRSKSVVGEQKFWEKLVAVGLIQLPSCVASVDSVFVIIIESVVFASSGFRESVGITFYGFVKNDQFSQLRRLPGLAEVSPETRFLHEVAATVEEVSAWFVLDLGLSCADGREASHVSRSAGNA